MCPGASRRLRAAIFVLAVSSPGAASAFCRTTTEPVPPSFGPERGCFTQGAPLFWRNQCVTYSMNQAASARVTLDQASAAMAEAFSTWMASACAAGNVGIEVSATEPVACSEVGYDQNGPNQNVVVYRDDRWPYSDPNDTLGLTTVTYDTKTGEIYDADMELNATGKNLALGEPIPANGYDLLSVVTHEAGHFLGLAHATSSTSTMFASYKPGATSLRSLAPDDVDGLCAIYPTKAERAVASTVSASGLLPADACDPTPRHGFGKSCDASPADGGCSCEVGPSARRVGDALAPLSIAVALAAIVGARRRCRRRRV